MNKKVEIKNTNDVVIPNEIKKGIDEGIQNVLSIIDDFNWGRLHDFEENISYYFSCGITYPEIYPTFSEGFGEFLYNEILEACGKEDDDYDYLEDYEDYINIRWEELYKKADVKVNDDYHSKYGIYYIDYGKDKKFDEKVDKIRFILTLFVLIHATHLLTTDSEKSPKKKGIVSGFQSCEIIHETI